MKKIIVLIVILFCYRAYSQSLSVFDVDTSAFPTMKASFYAFDSLGKQMKNLSPSDFSVMENGANRTVLSVSCPQSDTIVKLSIAMSLDVSGSMAHSDAGNTPVELGKKTITDLINFTGNNNEYALQTCTDIASIVQDFTIDKNRILNNISPITAGGDNDFVEQLLNPKTGLLNIAKAGKYKRVAIIYTDAWWNALTDSELQQCIDLCKSNNIIFYAIIYTRPEAEPNGIKSSLKKLADATGGVLYDGITSEEAVKQLIILLGSHLNLQSPCAIEWQSLFQCLSSSVTSVFDFLNNNTKDTVSYTIPPSSIASIVCSPSGVYFKNKAPGKSYDTIITVTAINHDFTITDIISSNAMFSVSPKSFILKDGNSIQLTVTFTPLDSTYQFAKLSFISDKCAKDFYSTGGFIGWKSKVQTLKLTNPNGGEIFVVGSDTVITWEGVLPTDIVRLEYSIDSGKTWKILTNVATGLSWTWRNIPLPTSNQCLVRVSYGGNNSTTPTIEWQKCFGGSNDEWASSIQQTIDGGFVVCGETSSDDSDVTGNHGSYDYWIVKLTTSGIIEWQKCLGGKSNDLANSIQQTSDGGFIVVGWTDSNDGDVTGNHGGHDYWVVKLSNMGIIEWQKCLGGRKDDIANSIQETSDGGYIIAGYTESNDGDVTGNHGDYDYWIVKLLINGEIEWQKCLGGTGIDYATYIQEKSNGGYIVSGYTDSNNGDVTGNHGSNDYWIVSLSNKGEIEWQKCFGGSSGELATSIKETSDGGFVVSGETSSNDGDVTSNHGADDYWIVKLTKSGILEWQKCLGGSGYDQANFIQETSDKGYIVTGVSESKNGDVTVNNGNMDYWAIKLSNSGNIEWQQSLGGTNADVPCSIQETNDAGYIIAGWSISNDRNVSGNHGSRDYWIVKLTSPNISQQDVSDSVFAIVAPNISSFDVDMKQEYVNKSKDSVIVDFLKNTGTYNCSIDTIYITGADADQFSVVNRSFPYQIASNSTKNIEFVFAPTSVGKKYAQVAIVIPSDTVYINITGEGVLPQLSVLTKLIDFGDVYVTDKKDTVVVLIENISSSNLTIKSLDMLGPDKTQFEALTATPFTMLAGEKKPLSLRFKPKYIGRTSGQIGFNFDDVVGTVASQLYGRGIGGLVYIKDDSAFVGEERNIPLRLKNIKASMMQGIATNFTANIRFNSTVLAINNNSININITNDTNEITILETIPYADSILYNLNITACLGNSDKTYIEITSFNWLDDLGNILDYDTETESGNFKILGICPEGSPRLINPNEKTTLALVKPNPTSDKLDIEFTLRENINTELYIVNLQGEKVMRIIDNTMETGNYKRSIDLQGLASGVYNIILKTPNDIKSKYFEIVK